MDDKEQERRHHLLRWEVSCEHNFHVGMCLPMTNQGRVGKKQLPGKSWKLYGTNVKGVYVVTDGQEAQTNNQNMFNDRGKSK
jgi:hypothetical protein